MYNWLSSFGPRQANLVLIAYASSEGSGEPAHPRSLARTFAARSYKQWVERNLQTENQIPGPSEWLDMRSWNLSWRNARRHKFAWRGSFCVFIVIVFLLWTFRESRKALKVLESLVTLPRLATPGGQRSINSRGTPQGVSPGNPPAVTV